jgi:hypothetical protein
MAQPRTFTIAARSTALPHVAGAQHLGDDGTVGATVTGLVHDGFGDGGIERLLGEVERFEAVLLQRADERAPDRLDALHLVGEGGLARVEHRQQRVDDLAGGTIDLVGLLGGDTLAVVLEVGLETQRDVLELVALGEERDDVVLDDGLRLGHGRRISGGAGLGVGGSGLRAGEVVDLAAALVLESEVVIGHDGRLTSRRRSRRR